ncbi:hypothetical protein F5Y16DRAFT_393564 [Xylariaceae sp. FL0255]|nr:hypothetical protein F5Y16DRAFT_393564 [Xylariaceae sp. FL0255]
MSLSYNKGEQSSMLSSTEQEQSAEEEIQRCPRRSTSGRACPIDYSRDPYYKRQRFLQLLAQTPDSYPTPYPGLSPSPANTNPKAIEFIQEIPAETLNWILFPTRECRDAPHWVFDIISSHRFLNSPKQNYSKTINFTRNSMTRFGVVNVLNELWAFWRSGLELETLVECDDSILLSSLETVALEHLAWQHIHFNSLALRNVVDQFRQAMAVGDFRRVEHHYRNSIEQQQYLDAAVVRFESYLIARCIYIEEFIHHHESEGGDLNGNVYSYRFYPALGPDPELDLWLLTTEIISQNGGNQELFDPQSDFLVHMYGFGRNELEYFTGRSDDSRGDDSEFRKESVKLLDRYHILRSVLGIKDTEDIEEQLRYYFNAILDYRLSHCSGTECPCKDGERNDCQREFEIARLMIDRLWIGFKRLGRRDSLIEKRVMMGDHGEWNTLSDQEAMGLLHFDPTLLDRWHPNYLPLTADLRIQL